MSLWVERYNELDRYYTYRQEAEQQRLVRQEQAGTKNAQQILARVMRWLGSCLAVIGDVKAMFSHHPIIIHRQATH